MSQVAYCKHSLNAAGMLILSTLNKLDQSHNNGNECSLGGPFGSCKLTTPAWLLSALGILHLRRHTNWSASIQPVSSPLWLDQLQIWLQGFRGCREALGKGKLQRTSAKSSEATITLEGLLKGCMAKSIAVYMSFCWFVCGGNALFIFVALRTRMQILN